MEYEQLGKQWGIDCINCRDEDGLLGESIDNNKCYTLCNTALEL